MTQLLISVKNLEETKLALDAGIDIIDLKDPNHGALGALNLEITSHIIELVDGLAIISATVGEQHTKISDLVQAIEARADMGVDIIKIAVSPLFYDEIFIVEMAKLSIVGIKIVAVFFADASLDLNLLTILKKIGFYGAMLDTQSKQNDLLHVQSKKALRHFVLQCEKIGLKSGLAGSLKSQYVEFLCELNPTYIGFRGGVCENSVRNTALSINKVIEVKNMLCAHNKKPAKPIEISRFALHT
jgi:(5-formylfuran-3-yl)methyl phosphate synthase